LIKRVYLIEIKNGKYEQLRYSRDRWKYARGWRIGKYEDLINIIAI